MTHDGSSGRTTSLTSAPRIAAYRLMPPVSQGDPLHHSSQHHTSHSLHTPAVWFTAANPHIKMSEEELDTSQTPFSYLFILYLFCCPGQYCGGTGANLTTMGASQEYTLDRTPAKQTYDNPVERLDLFSGLFFNHCKIIFTFDLS